MASAIIIVEFPTAEQAQIWYRFPDNAQALAVRDQALSRNLIPVDGVSAGAAPD
jgi:uncharacterized protein (DUF1330 family)